MLTHALLMDLAEELFRAAFEQPRERRNDVYKQGVKAAMLHQAVGTKVPMPYDGGTVESDAFYAGVSEGYAVWREYTQTTGRVEG